tara:strand:- start:323 stop:646 length:324 start_codon:yes stop_codon:yes gene_type:complete
MTQDQYILMCEELGWDPDPEEMPIDYADLDYEAQQALLLFNTLPDKLEGMNGVWLGKDYAGLGDIISIYEMTDIKETFGLLQICISEASKYYEQQRKVNEARSKARR